jgi:GT2 family glycosyltransferase
MNIAVVILNWNGLQLLEQFYLLIAFSPETIYIADNASTDESIAFVQQHYLPLKS